LTLDRPLKGKLDLENGELVLIELPSQVHELTHSSLNAQIHFPLLNWIDALTSSTIPSNIPGNRSMQGDQSYRPRNVPPGTPQNWVTLVVEIGFYRTMLYLQRKANRWLTETSCNEVILIKVSIRRRRMSAEVWRRAAGNPVQQLRFDGMNCTALGQQVLQISLASIFPGIVPPAVIALYPMGTLPVDLFPIKQAIERAQ